MNEDLNTGQMLRLHKLKGKIYYLLGITWTQFLILCALKELEKADSFGTTNDLIDLLEMDKVWVYRHLNVLRDIGAVTMSAKSPWTPRIVSLEYAGRLLLTRMELLLATDEPVAFD
ncbi:MAG: hypothetical protein JNN04_12265 [Cyclobacteriaceae bacterium]|nr:hypothetical protein [Cyclobacteriaceae bacterium]